VYLIHDVLEDDSKQTAPDSVDAHRQAVGYTDQPEVSILLSITHRHTHTINCYELAATISATTTTTPPWPALLLYTSMTLMTATAIAMGFDNDGHKP